MAVATTSDFDTTFFIDEVIEEAFAMIVLQWMFSVVISEGPLTLMTFR